MRFSEATEFLPVDREIVRLDQSVTRYFAEVPALEFDSFDLQDELSGASRVECLSGEDAARDWIEKQKQHVSK